MPRMGTGAGRDWGVSGMRELTLGSLFDGIGGFPLSGAMHGIKPIWASEIEPFPILVTTKRFPEMKHLGSVTDIRGDQVEPVDILTFGSPCQDLSVAGAQKGIHEGARSSLFFEAVRIIKEMRNNDKSTGRTGKNVRPRFAVWENVPGAYSSNKGRDFQAVLQALCEVADPDVHVPFPEGGKWQKAGCIVGEGYSVAWRTLDAQYFPRTPQRRKRIYLVADFGSERAGEILFKPHSVRGHSAEGGKEGQGTAEDAEGGAGGSCGVRCLNPWDTRTIRQYDVDGVFPALAANSSAGMNRQGVLYEPKSLMEENWARQDIKNALRAEASKSSHVVVGVFMGGQGAKAGSIAYDENISPTLRAAASGSNRAPDVVYCLQGNGIDRADTAGCNGRGWRDIVRRLMPLECCRLQGYPDGWTENLEAYAPTKDQVVFFTEVWERWATINGTKPKSRSAVFKWLQAPASDSAQYKAYGNSLAIPCSSDVLGRIAAFMEEEQNVSKSD